jgi:acylphosphatase
MNMAGKVRAHAIISGRVQGVFYRAETRKAARRRGVTGWVKNRPDGTVEAVFEGDENDVAAMIEWCKSGSSQARVDNVDVDWETNAGEFSAFEVAY